MDQSSTSKPSAPKSNLKWLLIVLAVVALGTFGYFYFYIIKPKLPPPKGEPLINDMISGPPETSNLPATTTPSNTTTTTPTSATSAIATPTPTPPAGWKLETNSVLAGHSIGGGHYKIFIRNSWSAVVGGDITYPDSAMLYGDSPACVSDNSGGSLDNCLFKVAASPDKSRFGDEYTYLVGNNSFDQPMYLIVSFNPAKISAADKKTVLASFQVSK